jgi:murein DD-endopeptidase MepM/ murein hydrolase activator NlpD
MNPKSVVLFSMAATGVIVIGGDAAKGKVPKPREVLGLFFTYLAIAAVADFAPKLAEPTAILVLTSSALYKGPALFNAIGNVNPNSPTGRETQSGSSATDFGTGGVSGTAGGPLFDPTETNAKGVRYPLGSHVTKGSGPGVGTHSWTSATVAGHNWESDNAVDLMVGCGTPVYAVDDGTIGTQIGLLTDANGRPVDQSGPLAGKRLHLKTKDNEWYYGHLSSINVSPGQKVKKGQQLGLSGKANGTCHLHIASEFGNPVTLIGA